MALDITTRPMIMVMVEIIPIAIKTLFKTSITLER